MDSRGFRPGPKQRAHSSPLILAANTTHLHKMNGVALLPDIATDTKTQAYKKWNLDSKNRSYIISIAKTVSKKIEALTRSVKFFSLEAALYLYKSTIRPCMKYCCHIWASAPSCYLEMLDKLQKRIYRTVGPSLATSPNFLAHRSTQLN